MTIARHKIPAAALVVVLVGTAMIAAYAVRDRLASLPLVGSLVAREGGHGEPAEAGGRPAPPPAPADPRAPVSLDLRRQQLIGVRTVPVEQTVLIKTIRAVGAVKYDETRLADVNIKVEGWIRDLFVDSTGAFVSKGQPLFTLYSPDLLAAQQEYLLALKTRDGLRQSQIADARERAERLVDAARTRIERWDVPGDQLAQLEETRQPQTTVTFRSPVSGFVIEKQALAGMHVTPGQTLYRVADLSRVWVEADLYEQEIPLVRTGQPATVTLDAYPGERFAGRVAYLYPFVQENTRTMRVRFDFANRGGRLKPGMYANVELQVPLGRGLTVPSDALVDSGTRQLVFVAEGDGYFQPRDVTVGQRFGDRVQILEGLKVGELVAAGAAFFLDSESQFRASVQGYQAPPPPAAQGAAAAGELAITFRSQPDPPRTGDNTLEVSVRDASGRPITDANVSVTFFMPAMPTMNMPAMRTETTLSHAGNGVYRGIGQVMMAGRWDVTVRVNRGGQEIDSEKLSVTAH
jgi:RND family efflux transporter MFP subunit